MRDRLDSVLAEIPDPRQGLPDEVFDFVLRVTPMINVDLLVRDERGRTLLAWREDPWGQGWHIVGGIIRFNEEARTRIAEVARLEFGAAIASEPAPCAINELRDSGRGHFISLLYRCVLPSGLGNTVPWSPEQGSPNQGDLAWFAGAPEDLYPAHDIYRRWLAVEPR